MQASRIELSLGAQPLIIETGKWAKQAHGSVVVRQGDTVVIVAAVEGEPREGGDFFPLQVDYREKTYAAGKFPGGFIKREGRPTSKEILTSRLIDRPIRPLFPAGYVNEVQVMVIALSFDRENDPDILSMIGSSAALHLSNIPFLKPTAAVRVGRINNELAIMPTISELEESELDLVVSGTRDAITMIEGFAREISEENMLQAIQFGHQHIIRIIDAIEQLRQQAGLGTKQLPPAAAPNPAYEAIRGKYYNEFKEKKLTSGKHARADAIKALREKVFAEFAPETGEAKFTPEQVSAAFSTMEERIVRDLILNEGKRIDGRSLKDIRKIECEVGVLPRTHGSAVFQRGETQALMITTLGTVSDEQRVDGLADEYSKKFMLDYNFPPFSVGECRPIRGPGRREIGHGALAERSLKAVIPNPSKFPYTIRLVSEILESNGSSSMASVCGGTLALMDAGVPITDPVAGISIGLVKEGNKFALLTDIMGDEDHFGDMDFKVAGTGRGVTGIQLDLKIDGINDEIIRATLDQAREARREILKSMLSVLRAPRGEISGFAPRLIKIRINPEKIGALIGPGGKNIKAIQESTGAKIDIEDDGSVYISCMDADAAKAAQAKVEAITEEVRIGKVYDGKVTSIKEFGAFIEILPGRDGLCHISELDDKYVGRVEDVCKVGDRLQVKVIAIDDQDRVKLSRKALLREQNPQGSAPPGDSGPPPRRDDRGPPRRDDRGPPRRDDRGPPRAAGISTPNMPRESPRTAVRGLYSPMLHEQYAELAELAGGFIHEIKNHLSTLGLNLQLLAEDFGEPQSQRERRAFDRVLRLQAECHRLVQVSNDFLRFAGVKDLALSPTNLGEVIEEMLDFFGPTARAANIEIKSYVPSDLPQVPLDRDLFKQAMLNLMINAEQAMPGGGELTIQAACPPLANLPDGRSAIELSLIDTGQGMTPEVRAKVFKPFFSTKPGGSGLGLPTVRKIIEAHHGQIDVQSDVGKGTKFTIRLPVVACVSREM